MSIELANKILNWLVALCAIVACYNVFMTMATLRDEIPRIRRALERQKDAAP